MDLFGPNIKKLKANQDVKALIDLLSHESQKVQEQARVALISIADYETIKMMVKFLKKKPLHFNESSLNKEKQIQPKIQKILIDIGEPTVITLKSVLERSLQPRSGEDILIGSQVKNMVKILGAIGSPSASEVLAKWLKRATKIRVESLKRKLKEGKIDSKDILDSSMVGALGSAAFVDTFKSKGSINFDSLKISAESSMELEDRDAFIAAIEVLTVFKDDRGKKAIEYALCNSIVKEVRVAAEKALKKF